MHSSESSYGSGYPRIRDTYLPPITLLGLASPKLVVQEAKVKRVLLGAIGLILYDKLEEDVWDSVCQHEFGRLGKG